ncbi:MAG: peptidylprolyl isomerase [Bacteroidota bacterium]
MKKLTFLFLFSLLANFAGAQTLDRIVAIIGEEVILQSDVENQYQYMMLNGQKDDGTLRCQVMENLVVNKLLLNKAQQDSIEVSAAEVTAEIDRRVEYILAQMDGNVREFERIYGKSVAEFREDIFDEIRDEVLINRQRNTLLQEAEITPSEVKAFYESLEVDSVGVLPAEVEVNHIVVIPPPSQESIDKALKDLASYREQAINGTDFNELAAKHSDEPGASRSRGYLGEFSRGLMVPEFEEVVYAMRVGEISQPFRTEFGYHVVLLHERRGQILRASHILKRLRPSTNGDSIAIDSLRKIVTLIETDSLSFEQAAIRFSSDRQTKHCGGCITNPQTQELRISMDMLDADMFFKVDEMEAGEISEPMELTMGDNSRAFHIMYLKNKIPPHKPNLKDDYQKIRDSALRNKQYDDFEKWLESAKKNIYIDIKPTECYNALKTWVQ